MRSMALIPTLVLALAPGSPARAGGKGGSFSCDLPSAKPRVCVDYAWSSGDYPEAGGRASCSAKGGTPGSACSRKGAVGGCKVAMGAGEVSISTTSWYYSGTAAELSATCAAMGGAVVKP